MNISKQKQIMLLSIIYVKTIFLYYTNDFLIHAKGSLFTWRLPYYE